ncbi:MAG: branched-chain amino acid ABC transporter permease [Microthrixaceae bacterium]
MTATLELPAAPGRMKLRPATIVVWIIVAGVLIYAPFLFEPFRVDQFSGWMTLAIGACGLNLLTGFNGQISVGHGALYGVGAYTAGWMINELNSPLLLAVLGGGVVCFVVGVIIGLPALRIKGLYLALVTLAVATLFPLAVEQFNSITGGSHGMQITSEQMYRGSLREKPIQMLSPFKGVEAHQWQYLVFLAITALCFLLSRNLIKSRVGRSLVAVRDNETAAEVSGIPVARVKIYTFGVGSALAGIGGGLFAIDQTRMYPSSFTIAVSIYFLVAVVIGGASSIIGPAVGALFYGVFSDVIIPELPNRLQPARAVILGVMLIGLMLVAPGGMVGVFRTIQAKFKKSGTGRSSTAAVSTTASHSTPGGGDLTATESPQNEEKS